MLTEEPAMRNGSCAVVAEGDLTREAPGVLTGTHPLQILFKRPEPSFRRATEMIEEEIIHWWRDENGELHRNALRLESETPQRVNGFPRDGVVTVRLMNTASQQAIRLSPEEALKVSTQLLSVAKEMMNQKRLLWNEQEELARA